METCPTRSRTIPIDAEKARPGRRKAAATGDTRSLGGAALFRAIVDSATDYAIIATDLAGRIVEWNCGAENALGWTSAEIVGRPLHTIFTPEDREAEVPAREMSRALSTGLAMDERWHLRRDGHRFWADGRLMPLRDENHAPIGYLKIVRDETARKLSSVSAAALRVVTDHADTAILQVDPSGSIVFTNPAAERLLGWSASELKGRPAAGLLAAESEDADPIGTRPFRHRDILLRTRSGDIKTVVGSQSPIMVDNRTTGAVLTLQDAAKRQLADATLRAEARRHEILARTQRAVESAWGDSDGAYRAVVQGALEILPQADAAAIELVDGDETVNFMTTDGARGEPGMRVPLDGSLAGVAIALGQAVICRDTETDDRVDRARSLRFGVRSMVVVPIARGATFIGVLKLSAQQPDAFAARDVLVAQVLVGHIVTAHARTDEASALQRLQRIEERLQLALDASETIGIWDWDVGEDRCYGDARLARLLALDRAEAAEGLPIRRFMDRVHAEDLIWVKAAARNAVAEAGEFAMEFRVHGEGEDLVWLFARGRVLPDPAGGAVRLLGAAVDITARKRTETSLRDAETNARLAVEAAGLGLWDYDPARDWLTLDKRCRRILGLSTDGIATLETLAASLHPRSRAGLRAIVRDALAAAHLTDRAHEFEIVRRDDRAERWIEASAQAFFTDRTCTRIVGTLADITDRKRLEANLREDEQRFRTMAESIPQLAWMANEAGVIVWFNERWFTYTGQEPGLIGSTGLRSATDPATAEAVAERLALAFRDGVPWDETVQLRRADGVLRWFLSRALPLRQADGSILRWLGTHTDIDDEVRLRETQARFGEDLERQVTARTAELSLANARLVAEMADRQRAEEALRQAQKMEAVGQLTGGIAHDFNNLLTGISGSLDLIRKRIEQGRMADVERYMSAAATSANRAAALTHRLLAFARRQPLDAKPVDVNGLAASMEDLFRRTLGESIEIALRLSPDLSTTLCDPHQLENALLNLVINARHAMPQGGRLTIATANRIVTSDDVSVTPDLHAGDYVALTVTDTGVGMPAEVMGRIFEPFFTTKPIGQGTGLGLSMIYGFARQSDGHITVRSEVGRGTTFTLLLPRFSGAPEDRGLSITPVPLLAGDGETVLVVEDEPVVRQLVLDVLADLGYRTLSAPDGVTGLAILQGSGRVDLLVTDVGLPGLTGRQLAEHGRERRPGLKVLYITGYAADAEFGRGNDPSVQMITKPFAIDSLAARIREMIASPG